MKLKFDPTLEYQAHAISAITDIFDGQPFAQTGAAAFQAIQIGGLFQTELGLANRLALSDEELLRVHISSTFQIPLFLLCSFPH